MKKRGLISTDNHIRQVPMENFHWHLKTTNYTTMAYLFPTSDLVLKFPGVKRHGALLCAHKGADLNTYLVSLRAVRLPVIDTPVMTVHIQRPAILVSYL